MTIFTHGSDKGFILIQSILLLFFLCIYFLITLELEQRRLVHAKREYEATISKYEVDLTEKGHSYEAH